MIGRRLMAGLALALIGARPAPPVWDAPGVGNPILPGYFADPSIVRDKGVWYIFATQDPWGSDHLALWHSRNLRDWTYSEPAWPSKAAATSPTSGDAMVWAPSVVQARNGRWYMYVSVGSEIWVGSAPSPAGPWADANGGRPLIPGNARPGYHMIDAEAFVDDDGQAYLAWGSGLHWVNGHCFMARLSPDMVHITDVRDVTPAHYFEAPFLLKAAGRYALTYSAGNTTSDTYQIRYATGPGPYGPFAEAPNSPLLATQPEDSIISPGHHAIFRAGGQAFVLYHRQALPWVGAGGPVLRQVAINALALGRDGLMRAHGDHAGAKVPGGAAARLRGLAWRGIGQGRDAIHGPERAADDNYATLWRPGPDGQMVADLGRVRAVGQSQLRPEYPSHLWRFGLEASTDGQHWRSIAPMAARQGSPIVLRHRVRARYLRLSVAAGQEDGVWEWVILP